MQRTVRYLLLALLTAMLAHPAAAVRPIYDPWVETPEGDPWLDKQAPPKRERVYHKLSEHELVRARLMPMRNTYYVGEPIEVPIKFINHTDHTVTAVTNLIPRAGLNVNILRAGERSRRSYGPHPPGMYGETDIKLAPYQEVVLDSLLWGDLDTESGLTFEEPGRYTVRLTLDMKVLENRTQGTLALGTIRINIVPTPEPLRPLVDALKAHKAFPALHRGRVPEGLEDRLIDLLESTPASAIHPYGLFAMSGLQYRLWEQHPGDRRQADSLLLMLQLVARSDSIYRDRAWSELLRFVDELRLSSVALKLSREYVRQLPEDRQGRVGDSPLLIKYLKFSHELDRDRSWFLFP